MSIMTLFSGARRAVCLGSALLAVSAQCATLEATGCSESNCIQLRARWMPPSEGSPVEVYEIQVLQIDVGIWETFWTGTDTTFVDYYPSGTIVRVRGRDAKHRYGPYSAPSDTIRFPSQIQDISYTAQSRIEQ